MASDPFLERFSSKNRRIKVQTIQNGVSPKGCPASEASVGSFFHSLGLSRGKNLLIGTVSRVVAERRPLEVADILINVLRETGPETHAVLGGEGALLTELRDKIRRSGVSDRFHLLGLVEDPLLVMSSLSVYLTLNVRETTGISGIEAALCRVPIVALQLEESHAVGPADWIWSSASASEVTAECVEMLRNPGRRALAEEKQYQVAENLFVADKMVERYLEFYESLETRP
jgi:glycosyltransferase involved in cell wall biosynthesis